MAHTKYYIHIVRNLIFYHLKPSVKLATIPIIQHLRTYLLYNYYAYVHKYAYMHTYVCACICKCLCTFMHVSFGLYMYICIYVRTHIHALLAFVHTYMHGYCRSWRIR